MLSRERRIWSCHVECSKPDLRPSLCAACGALPCLLTCWSTSWRRAKHQGWLSFDAEGGGRTLAILFSRKKAPGVLCSSALALH